MDRGKVKKKEKGKELEKEKIREKQKEKGKGKEVEKEKIEKEKEKEKGKKKSKSKEEKRKEWETEKEKEQLKGEGKKEKDNSVLAKTLLELPVRDHQCLGPLPKAIVDCSDRSASSVTSGPQRRVLGLVWGFFYLWMCQPSNHPSLAPSLRPPAQSNP